MKTTNNDRIPKLENTGRDDAVASFPDASAFSDFGFRRYASECSHRLAELKEHVADELTRQFRTLSARLVEQVVNEADSLAATTPFPALFLPALAEEKVRHAAAWAARQKAIFGRNLPLAA